MTRKTVHGHYSDLFEEESARLKRLYKEKLNIDISWIEATSLAAERSADAIWDVKKLKSEVAKLRGL